MCPKTHNVGPTATGISTIAAITKRRAAWAADVREAMAFGEQEWLRLFSGPNYFETR